MAAPDEGMAEKQRVKENVTNDPPTPKRARTPPFGTPPPRSPRTVLSPGSEGQGRLAGGDHRGGSRDLWSRDSELRVAEGILPTTQSSLPHRPPPHDESALMAVRPRNIMNLLPSLAPMEHLAVQYNIASPREEGDANPPAGLQNTLRSTNGLPQTLGPATTTSSSSGTGSPTHQLARIERAGQTHWSSMDTDRLALGDDSVMSNRLSSPP